MILEEHFPKEHSRIELYNLSKIYTALNFITARFDPVHSLDETIFPSTGLKTPTGAFDSYVDEDLRLKEGTRDRRTIIDSTVNN